MLAQYLSRLKDTVLWVIEQDEIEQEFSWKRVVFTILLYGTALVLIVLVGAILLRYGYGALGFGLWFFGIPFAAFAGTINVAWGILRFWFERREVESAHGNPQEPKRDLAPDFQLSNDAKIGFIATILGLLALLVAFQVTVLLISFVL